MIIRKMKSSEIDLVSELAIRSKAYWRYLPEFMKSCEAELTIQENKFNDKNFIFFVAELEHFILGFYTLEKLSKTDFELDALFVEPQKIGKGIGKKLLTHAKKIATKLGAKTLRIQGDPHAEKFYLANGAKLIGKEESKSITGRFLPLYQITI